MAEIPENLKGLVRDLNEAQESGRFSIMLPVIGIRALVMRLAHLDEILSTYNSTGTADADAMAVKYLESQEALAAANTHIAALEAENRELREKLTKFEEDGAKGKGYSGSSGMVHRIDVLKQQLRAMTADRNLWQDEHNGDCPNVAARSPQADATKDAQEDKE